MRPQWSSGVEAINHFVILIVVDAKLTFHSKTGY
jgi:hypothetical protein